MERTDSAVQYDGMMALLSGLGKVDAERFISLIIKEPFDYTEWQKSLFNDETVYTLSKKAMKTVNKK